MRRQSGMFRDTAIESRALSIELFNRSSNVAREHAVSISSAIGANPYEHYLITEVPRNICFSRHFDYEKRFDRMSVRQEIAGRLAWNRV